MATALLFDNSYSSKTTPPFSASAFGTLDSLAIIFTKTNLPLSFFNLDANQVFAAVNSSKRSALLMYFEL